MFKSTDHRGHSDIDRYEIANQLAEVVASGDPISIKITAACDFTAISSSCRKRLETE